MDKRRVLIIGLDGATFRLIKPLISQGKLPVLSRLLKEGSHGELESTMPPMSAQAWTSFMTGRNIGKHGLVDFLIDLCNAAFGLDEFLHGALARLEHVEQPVAQLRARIEPGFGIDDLFGEFVRGNLG